jgi:hypothetical protein
VAVLLALLAIGVAASPANVPGLTVPSDPHGMSSMSKSMDSMSKPADSMGSDGMSP